MSYQDADKVRRLVVGNAAAKSVLRCLADCCNSETGQCNPSIDTISRETELNRKTVYKAIAYLEEKGFVRRERIVLNSSNNYVLNIDSDSRDTKNGTCPKNGSTKIGSTKNGTSPKNGSTKIGSTKNGTSPKNGLSVGPNMGRVVGPNLGHESVNESVKESVNNSIGSAPNFSLTSPEKTTISKKETVEKKAKRQKKEKLPCPYNEDDQIPEEFVKVAQKHNIQDPQQLFSKMVAYCKANGKQYADYKAAFTTWCLNESKWQQQKPPNQTSKPFAYEPPGGFTDDYYRDQCEFDENGNLKL
ncbi:MAG: helix-turn-helix domain-containing protein [Parasutterella sp.]|uniref:helix-turn-helix domain-containing protein n=1 Tax=Parasutterella sp. TaxID=2049037 RepID=UPI00399A266D